MQLTLNRTYYPTGTNGVLTLNGKHVCYTIELPWKDNQPQHSCIPEGTYTLSTRFSMKFRTHLLVNNVPNRSLILIHPANDALTELRGCIAPVCLLTGPGTGIGSRVALGLIISRTLNQRGSVQLLITGFKQPTTKQQTTT